MFADPLKLTPPIVLVFEYGCGATLPVQSDEQKFYQYIYLWSEYYENDLHHYKDVCLVVCKILN